MKVFHRFFFYVTILFLPTQLGLHLWPQWTFILGRRVDYLSPTIYLTDILIALTLLFWLLSLVLSSRRRPGSMVGYGTTWMDSRLRGNDKKTTVVFLGIVFLSLLNIFISSNKPVAIYSWIKVFKFITFGFYIIKTKPKVSIIVDLLTVGIFYSSIIAIAHFFLQRAIGGPLWFLGERLFTSQTPGIAQVNWCWPAPCRLLLRPYATFPHPNVLGGFLAVTLPLIIQQILQMSQIRQMKKFFFIISTVLGLVALILTFSRSAWIVGMLVVSWIFIPKIGTRKFSATLPKSGRLLRKAWRCFRIITKKTIPQK